MVNFTWKKGDGIHGFWWLQWGLWFHVALLGNPAWKVDLVCAPEGLVTIVTCSSGEAGNTVTGKGIGEECTTFWLCIDWFLIAATENGHGTAGGLNALIPRAGRALYFTSTNGNPLPHHPKCSNHCQLQAPAYHGRFWPFDILVRYYWDRWHASLTNLQKLRSLFSFLTPKHNLWKPDLPSLSSARHILEISASYIRIHKPF